LRPSSEFLVVVTDKKDVLSVDLGSGRVDAVVTAIVQAALGPDGTLYTVDAKRRVVSLARRVRFVWPQPLGGVPRELFGGSDQRLVAVDPPKLITAAADQPPTSRTIPVGGDVAATRWGDLIAVASDSGVLLLDALGRREPAFVRLEDHPRALVFSPSGHRIYVARRTEPGLAVIDRYEHAEIDGVALPTPAAAIRLDPLGRWLLARPTVGDSAWLVDLPVKRLVGSVATAWRVDLPAIGAAGGRLLYVQVSTAQNEAWSSERAQQPTRAGLAARVLPPHGPDDGYRVVLGPYPTRAQAEAIGRKLGRPFWIYQPAP